MQYNPIPPRRESRRRRIWPWVILLFVFIGAAALGALFASSSLLDRSPDDVVEEGLLTSHDKTTVMIMGVDERADDVGRSDTLMIATLDPKKNQAALLSIPRDTRVRIKGHGFDKINAAFAYGGEKLTQDTVENFLGVNMDHYVIVNLQAFQKIIDAIGGIDIDVEKRMYYEDPWDDDGGLIIDLHPGMQHMDGKTAITYVRYRDEEGDIGRIKRQQKFMKACMDKITSPSIIPQLPSVIREVSKSVRTDLSVRQILEFAGTLKEAQKNGLKTDMVPGTPLYIDGVSYWIPDVDKLRHSLADTLGIQMDSTNREHLEKTLKEYKNSIPANAKTEPGPGASTESTKKSSSSTSSTMKRKEETSHSSSTTRRETESREVQEKSAPVTSKPAGSNDVVAPVRGSESGKTQ